MLADAETTPWPEDAIEVGRIGEAWGIKGWFHVVAHAADPQALFSSRRWYLKPPEQVAGLPARAKPPAAAATAAAAAVGVPAALPTLLHITQAREHGDRIVAAAREAEDRAGAEALRGARIFVPRSSFPTAGEGEYYWIDLIGLDVVNRQGEVLGQVLRMMDNGAQSILCVSPGPEAPERLIPFVDAFVDRVDLAARRITVDWGLDY
jgi:16S rRNA processing protein RimM